MASVINSFVSKGYFKVTIIYILRSISYTYINTLNQLDLVKLPGNTLAVLLHYLSVESPTKPYCLGGVEPPLCLKAYYHTGDTLE